MMSLRAAGYCRSNDADLSGQKDLIRAYCEQHGLFLSRFYEDPESSALHLRRPGLKKLLDDAYDGYFEAVVVCDTSRLSRRLGDLYKIQNRLRQCRVALHLCRDDRQTAFRSDGGGLSAYSSKDSKTSG